MARRRLVVVRMRAVVIVKVIELKGVDDAGLMINGYAALRD